MGRPCSKTRPPSLGTRNNFMGPKERTTGSWKTKYEMGGRHEETIRKHMDQNSEEQERVEKLRESHKSASVSVSVRKFETSLTRTNNNTNKDQKTEKKRKNFAYLTRIRDL
jgi:hypothetical protein